MVDLNEITARHVNRTARVEIAPLVQAHREALLGEHQERPFGPHSDRLYRVLTFLRRIETEPRHVIVMTEPHREWTIGLFREQSDATPKLLDDERYETQEGAEHAVFQRRLDAFEDRFSEAMTEVEEK